MTGQLVKIVRFDEESEQAILTLANEIKEWREEMIRQAAEFLEMMSNLVTEIRDTLSLEMQEIEQEWSIDGEG